MMRSQDRFRGCLIGGAAGDALGYAVEFLREKDIFRKYGETGITEYDRKDGLARISDDTQMTLFTATGLLYTTTRFMTCGGVETYTHWINESYLAWRKTQTRLFPLKDPQPVSWLIHEEGLFRNRAPGNTCMSALFAGGNGTIDRPLNDSKGCGGIMRVAPIGLYFNDREKSVLEICRLGADTAALTHGGVLGWMPAAAFVQILHEVSQDGTDLKEAVLHAVSTVEAMWPETEDRTYFVSLMRKAVDLSEGGQSDLEAIHMLGEGWVAEETLAIAVYCALRYPGDIDRALIASVNHNGDSDSTGAVTGNIVGAQVGLSGIPAKYTDRLELRDLVLEVADDLWRDCPLSAHSGTEDPEWTRKYVTVQAAAQ